MLPPARQGPYDATGLKFLTVWLRIVYNVVSGDYVNFGVFKLYGDPALPRAHEMLCNLLLAPTVDDVLVCQRPAWVLCWAGSER